MLLIAGSNPALLEGLSQSLTRTGSGVLVAHTLDEAEDLRAQHRPVLVIVERALLASCEPGHPFIGGVVPSGSALVTYRESGQAATTLSPGLSRLVVADLELPLERNRLTALAEHTLSRARTVGRSSPVTGPESPAS
ncbi:MAG TPA: hypothetical protein VF981_15220 [Gemmatimonadaceae bacterium]